MTDEENAIYVYMKKMNIRVGRHCKKKREAKLVAAWAEKDTED